MAYKFQSGAAIASGSLVQEGLLDIKGSLQISGSSAIDASRNFAGGTGTFTGNLSSSGDLQLGAGQDINIGGSNVLEKGTLGSTVLASSLTSVGTLSSLNVGNVTSTGILSGTNATLAVGGAVSIGGASVLNATTLGSAVLASSLTSVGTLSSLNVGNVTSTGNLSGSNVQLAVGGEVAVAGDSVLNHTTIGSTVVASSLTSVGTLVGLTSSQPIIAQVGVRSSGPLSGSGDLTLGAGGDVKFGGTDTLNLTSLNFGGASVLNATTLGSAVVASSLTSVGTLSSLNVGAVTSTGIVSSSNDGRFLALDINGNQDVIDSSANFSGGSVTAQLKISSSLGVSGSSGKFLGLMSASHYVGNGAGLTNIAASSVATAVTSSTGAGISYELAYVEYLGPDVDLGGSSGLHWTPNDEGAVLVMSGSFGGLVSSELMLGSNPTDSLMLAVDDGAASLKSTAYGITISGSTDGALKLYSSEGTNSGVFIAGTKGLKGLNQAENGINWSISQAGAAAFAATTATTISGSSTLQVGGAGTFNSTITAVGVVTSNAGLKAGGSSYGVFANDLTRSAGDLNIKLHDASANNVGFRLASGTKPLVVYSTNYVTVTSLTASSGVQFDSTVQLDGAGDVSASIQADSVYFRDASNGLIKRESFVDIVSAIAGAGITATGGVLSTQAQSVTSGSNAFGAVTLVEGYNYFGDVTGTMVATLPAAPTVGDVVNVKAKSISSAQSIKITGSAAHTIDGDGFINVESSYGAVGLVYVAANDWRVV